MPRPSPSQPSLFGPEPDEPKSALGAYGRASQSVPHNGRPTSKAAALAAEPRAGTWRAKVLEYIRGRGIEGATRDEAIAALGMNPSTLRPRWVELAEDGLIVNSGRTRPNANNLQTEVYTAREYHEPR
jgi:hypothetical protein